MFLVFRFFKPIHLLPLHFLYHWERGEELIGGGGGVIFHSFFFSLLRHITMVTLAHLHEQQKAKRSSLNAIS